MLAGLFPIQPQSSLQAAAAVHSSRWGPSRHCHMTLHPRHLRPSIQDQHTYQPGLAHAAIHTRGGPCRHSHWTPHPCHCRPGHRPPGISEQLTMPSLLPPLPLSPAAAAAAEWDEGCSATRARSSRVLLMPTQHGDFTHQPCGGREGLCRHAC